MQPRYKLLVIELDYHASLLNSLCPMLAERFDLSLMTTRKIWELTSLSESDFNDVKIKEKREPIRDYISRCCSLLEQTDVIYFNTLEKYTGFFSSFQFPAPAIMRVHNINATFRPMQSVIFTATSWPKAIWFVLVRGVITRNWQARRRLLRNVDAIMMPSSGIAEYSQKHGLLSGYDNVLPYSMPFSYLPQPAPEKALDDKKLVLSVLGTVDVTRKNYTELFEAMKLLQERSECAVELHFLGAVKGKEGRAVIDQFKGLESDWFTFFYSTQFVSQQEVDAVMIRTHFLIAPIRLESNFKMHREVYGCTRMSGVEIDVVNYQTAAFVPSGYHVVDDMRTLLRQYTNATDLAEQVHALRTAKKDSIPGVGALQKYKKIHILDQFAQTVSTLSEA